MSRYGLLEDEPLFSVDFMIIKIAPLVRNKMLYYKCVLYNNVPVHINILCFGFFISTFFARLV